MNNVLARVRIEYTGVFDGLASLPKAVKILLTILLSVPTITLILSRYVEEAQIRSLSAMGGIAKLVTRVPVSETALAEMRKATDLHHAAQAHLYWFLIAAACIGIGVIVGMWISSERDYPKGR